MSHGSCLAHPHGSQALSPGEGRGGRWAVDAPPAQTVVVLLTVFLNHAHADVLRALSAHPRAHATILCALSEAQHAAHPDVPFGRDAYAHYTRLLREVRVCLPSGSVGANPNPFRGWLKDVRR